MKNNLFFKMGMGVLIVLMVITGFLVPKEAFASDPIYQTIANIRLPASENGHNIYVPIGNGFSPNQPIYLKLSASHSHPWIQIYQDSPCDGSTNLPNNPGTFSGRADGDDNSMLFYDSDGTQITPGYDSYVTGDPIYASFLLPDTITPSSCITLVYSSDPNYSFATLYGGVVTTGKTYVYWTGGQFVLSNDNTMPFFYNSIPLPYFSWDGFFQPIDNPPTLNQVRAGSAIPIKFSLNGNMGLNIFKEGYPKSVTTICDQASYVDALEMTFTAGGSSLNYDPITNQYNYVWKTEKSWTGCRQLIVKLNDGTTHYANFKFTK